MIKRFNPSESGNLQFVNEFRELTEEELFAISDGPSESKPVFSMNSPIHISIPDRIDSSDKS